MSSDLRLWIEDKSIMNEKYRGMLQGYAWPRFTVNSHNWCSKKIINYFLHMENNAYMVDTSSVGDDGPYTSDVVGEWISDKRTM